MYNPKSHFFTEHKNLSIPLTGNYSTDAFGPVTGNQSTQYRTTSIVRSNKKCKVFAITDGQILYQRVTGLSDKVNIILKPNKSFGDLNIKYFIYRNINIADVIDEVSGNLEIKNTYLPGNEVPNILPSVWQEFLLYNDYPKNPSPVPQFLATKTGCVEDMSATILIDDVFNLRLPEYAGSYNLISCRKGQQIGSFNVKIGLDIVLDRGDYQLEHEDELFKFNLEFARKEEHVFDSSLILTEYQKKYKEYINYFLDPAAFWGSHIECGEVILFGETNAKNTSIDIYKNIVNKFQTKDKLYICIIGQRSRVYNYYNDIASVVLPVLVDVENGNAPLQNNETYGWPIIIKSYSLEITNKARNLKLNVLTSVTNSISSEDKAVSIYTIIPNFKKSNFLELKDLISNNNSRTLNIKIPIKNYKINNKNVPISSFSYLYCYIKQDFNYWNYYNNLWVANIKEPFHSSSNLNSYISSSVIQYLNHNLTPAIDVKNTIVHQKVFFDYGNNSSGERKKRRLYITAIHKISESKNNYLVESKNNSEFTSSININNYNKVLYNSSNLDVYKGVFLDTAISASVNSLSLISKTDYRLKKKFIQFGITEEEYDKLFYIGVGTPDGVINIPEGVNNIKFHFEQVEINTNNVFRKYKLGLQFENSMNELQVLYPNNNVNIYAYTTDGLYFYTKAYSEYQEFYQEFSTCRVEFRHKVNQIKIEEDITLTGIDPTDVYRGEFGFDFLRVGDLGEEKYKNIITSGYEKHKEGDSDNNKYEAFEAYDALKNEYQSIPMKVSGEVYYTPWLNIFPITYVKNPMPTSTAELMILLSLDNNVSKLEFDYDSEYFSVNKDPISGLDNKKLSDITRGTVMTTGLRVSNDKIVKIACLKEFSDYKKIRIYEYSKGPILSVKLAGEIIICPNSADYRKEIDMVLVNVSTDINGLGSEYKETGSVTETELTILRKLLGQSLIYSRIIQIMEYDVRSDIKYQTAPFVIGEPFEKRFSDVKGITKYIKGKFLKNESYKKYKGYFTFFVFGENSDLAGLNEDIGVKNVTLFSERTTTTLSHESMHGFGLRHTHSDGDENINLDQKYVYVISDEDTVGDITNNIMSYSNYRISIWKWQWDIVK